MRAIVRSLQALAELWSLQVARERLVEKRVIDLGESLLHVNI